MESGFLLVQYRSCVVVLLIFFNTFRPSFFFLGGGGGVCKDGLDGVRKG